MSADVCHVIVTRPVASCTVCQNGARKFLRQLVVLFAPFRRSAAQLRTDDSSWRVTSSKRCENFGRVRGSEDGQGFGVGIGVAGWMRR